MHLSDFAFDLPPELIAQHPAPHRGDSRLLVARESEGGGDDDSGGFEHRTFRDIIDLMHPGDVLVVNDTRVIKARLRGRKESGGGVEILVERIEQPRVALCMARASRSLKPGQSVRLDGAETDSTWKITVRERVGTFYRLEFPHAVEEVLDRFGEVPLPPYIERNPGEALPGKKDEALPGKKDEALPGKKDEDEVRYQTVYAEHPGAVAAPTAGLHFDAELLDGLKARGVAIAPITLHVGLGTFAPVRTEDISQHKMHGERYAIPASTRLLLDELADPQSPRAQSGGRVVAVGTTVVRTLEAAALSGEDAGETDIFIKPGFRFRVVDALITNFHLPRSTLIMLVSAFAGFERTRAAYQEAIDHGYRFFSYGDAMFCTRASEHDEHE